ncbi:MAG: type II secretion system protein [Alphaproteobacteria bacterium]|nr:MAG: type II secretion system protein [Alphaproteobacteria bacterium]TAF13461.1 MAG: type II secretion system protein [Alphaproteobacteria bacterium]TAF41276.1 MAG: type II secretion system protein [Alphaproteobacteria bacterium]TAF76289.1 MAG: type II secretion system protein [Alphaproteobacteria bacterium]
MILIRSPRLNKQSLGFSLIELSIVLVILGLLAGSILAGQHLIRAAELRNILREKEHVQTAVGVFVEKYDGLPGDMHNATALWGTMPVGTCNNFGVGASGATGTQTCNGNGDGIVHHVAPVVGSNIEGQLFWQHLSNAGLIEGRFNGVFTGWGRKGEFFVSKGGNNLYLHPQAYIPPFFNNYIVPITDMGTFEGAHGNTLVFYKNDADFNFLTPAEAYGIDRKIDDGLPGVGNVITRERDGVNCNTLPASGTTPAANFRYNLSFTDSACELEFTHMW